MSGQKRVEVLVRLVGHEDALAQVLGFYQGQKESERTLVEDAIKAQAQESLQGQCWSLDTLFATLTLLHGADARYVVSLNANQSELLAQTQGLRQQPTVFDWPQCEKGQDWVEERHYQGYELPLWHL